MSSSSMHEDFRRVGDLEPIGVALARYAEALSPGGAFQKEGGRWIYRPHNFITFRVQPRIGGILLTLSGHPIHYKERAAKAGFYEDWLKTGSEMASYTTYSITDASQLLAAAQFIKWASEYGRKGRKLRGGPSRSQDEQAARRYSPEEILAMVQRVTREVKASSSGNESCTPR